MTGAEVLLNLVIGMTGSLIAAVVYDYARNRYQLHKRQRRFTLQLRASDAKETFRAFLKKVVSPSPTSFILTEPDNDHFTFGAFLKKAISTPNGAQILGKLRLSVCINL